jgi:transcriptional regulator with XRE-family HTH domain
MKTKKKNAIRELRRIIGKTQGEFAAMIGASKDTVASWEIGRNKLSESFARRIGFATGVEGGSLLRGGLPLMSYVPFSGRHSFTREIFEAHRKSYWGRSDEEAARQHSRNCADALGILFAAASRPQGKVNRRLPAVVDSFIQWCDRTREDFRLEREIEEQLRKRPAKLAIKHNYGEWRRMRKEDPAACRAMGFRDDPRKSDKESLTLETTTFPIWRPGFPMRGG